MVEERGYTSRVAPGGPGRAVLVDADVFGAGLGRAAEQAGDQLHQGALRSYRAQRQIDADEESAAAQSAFAAARLRVDMQARDLQNTLPGGKGYAEAVGKLIEAERETILAPLKEDSARRSFGVQMDEWSAGMIGRADQYEDGRRIGQTVTDIGLSRDAAVNRIKTSNGNKDVWGEELKLGHAALDAAEMPDDVREKLRREMVQAYSLAFNGERITTDPAAVLLELEGGAWDNQFTPEQIAAQKRGAQNEIQARANEAAEAAQDARDAARKDLATLQARVGVGDIPSQREINSVVERARSAGVDEASVIKFIAESEDAQRDRAFSAAVDPTGARAARTVAEIDARILAGTASAADHRQREKLAGIADARAKDAAAELKEMAGTTAGMIEAVGRLAGLPSMEQRFAGGQELGDNVGHIAVLPTAAVRSAAIEGGAIRKDRPDIVKKIDFSPVYSGVVGNLSRDLGEQYGAKMEVAMNLYANWAARTGNVAFDKAAARKYVNVAFGAVQRSNGQWQGGIGEVNDRAVILPDKLTQAELLSTIARTDWSQARGRDGSPVAKSFIVAKMHPELVDETPTHMIYNMVDPRGAELRGPTGKVLPFVVPKAISK